ncbi:MAG: response regulator [Candidatus Marinimicrobia bacterium]|nr:response regulator [Candidatus Neomarinimicrobiota bacterium]
MADKKTILIVEDDYDSQQLFYYLVRKQYIPVMVTNVADALSEIKKQPIHLVLLDLSLSGSDDGLTISRFMKKEDDYKSIPIIAVTAHAFETDHENCMEGGCDEFITKPIIRQDLMAKIDAMI